MTSAKRNDDDVQVERFVWYVHVELVAVPRKTLGEAGVAVNAVYGSSPGFPCPSDVVPVADDETF